MSENKIAFVKGLGELLSQYSREGVESCEYVYEPGNGEFALIKFKNSEYKKKVNINHDSVIAIMADIHKALC